MMETLGISIAGFKCCSGPLRAQDKILAVHRQTLEGGA